MRLDDERLSDELADNMTAQFKWLPRPVRLWITNLVLGIPGGGTGLGRDAGLHGGLVKAASS